MKVIVTGGRHYGLVPKDTPPEALAAAHRRAHAQRETLWAVLDLLCDAHPVTLVHGDARGADRWAAQWLLSRNRGTDRVIAVPADWQAHGRSAGMRRNLAMVQAHIDADVGVVFPGGNGTAHCAQVMDEHGIELFRVRGVG